jgi:peptidoglycan/xylan/chitin deacetylase (PgdA/CDA1 family)
MTIEVGVAQPTSRQGSAPVGAGAVTVLMYHAVLGADDDRGQADTHYAVTRSQFARHVDVVHAARAMPCSVLSLLHGRLAHGVAFTFDDGHASNEWAARHLADAGGSGDFFVNTSTVGTSGFLSWSALRDMAATGMSIQSHGHLHRFLDELTPQEVDDELQRSKSTLEDRLGRKVELFAPPGGRVPAGFVATAKRAGYGAVCSSRVDIWREPRGPDVPRFAVLRGTTDTQLERWVRQDRSELMAQRIRAGLLDAGKKLLGNRGYEKWRSRLLGQSAHP